MNELFFACNLSHLLTNSSVLILACTSKCYTYFTSHNDSYDITAMETFFTAPKQLPSISNDGSTTRTQSGTDNLSCRDSSDSCRRTKSLWHEIQLDYGISLSAGLDRMNVMLASVMYWVVWHNVLRWRRNVYRMVVNRPNDPGSAAE